MTAARAGRILDGAVGQDESEEALMLDYARGDERAFERLFTRLAPRVHALFMASFRDRALADDLLQKTFLKLHNARGAYRAGEPLRPWLFTIAARVRLDEYRRRYRLRESAGEEELEAALASQAAAPVSDGDSLNANVRAAVDRLPEAQRLVVHLHRYEGLAFPEIARALGTSEGAIKQRAFRAYAQLRRELAPLVGKEKVA